MKLKLFTGRIAFLPGIILFLVFASACGSVKDLELTGIRGFNVKQISTAGIDGEIKVGLKNPNGFGVTIYPSEFAVRYSGVDLGTARLAKKVRVKRNCEATYTLNVKSDFKNVNLADVMKLLRGGTFANEVEVKGDLVAGRLFYRRRVPVHLKEKITLR